MAKKPKVKGEVRLWSDIGEESFLAEKNIVEHDVGEFNKEQMVLYGLNTNIMRHMMQLMDGIKPSMRRLMYALYLDKCYGHTKHKSTLIMGKTMIWHGHGDDAMYEVMVGASLNSKMQCPLITIKGNGGNTARPELYADKRYTEGTMSRYAKECLFEDYDADCVEMVFNSTADQNEPIRLPAKFPNALVNGGMGIAIGNSFRVPPYNIEDIIRVVTDVIDNPDLADVYMIPDLPSGCQIIDDGENFRKIIDTGKGVMKMRANSEIIDNGKTWEIKFTSLPWLVSLTGITTKIRELMRSGSLAIKDVQDHCYSVIIETDSTINDEDVVTRIDFRIIIDKAHDPHSVLEKLYSYTDLQKSVSIDLKFVADDLSIERLNMRQLIQGWIDERRTYKRSLFNQRLVKLLARISLLEVLIYLTEKDNIERTLRIVKESNSDELIERLMQHGKMTSFQAKQIAGMSFRDFTRDARHRYLSEYDAKQIERDALMNIITDEDRIDDIIKKEMLDLRKYGSERRSEIIAENTERYISDTNHTVVFTKDGFIKKHNFVEGSGKNYHMGAFRTNDYPVEQLVVHNTVSINVIDSFGRYTTIPVHDIDSTEPSSHGHKVHDILKLNGRIVRAFQVFDDTFIKELTALHGEPYMVTLTEGGFGKKTPMTALNSIKSDYNVRIMKNRPDDLTRVAEVLFNSNHILIYTRKGNYSIVKVENITEQGRDAMGVTMMKLQDDDAIAGICVIGKADTHVIIATDKGMCKSISVDKLGEMNRRMNSKPQGNLIKLDSNDAVSAVCAIDRRLHGGILAVLRNSYDLIDIDSIPDTTKISKGRQLIHAHSNSNLVRIEPTNTK